MDIHEAIRKTNYDPQILHLEIRDYIFAAPLAELQTYIAAVPNTCLGGTFARTCIDVRLAEQAAKAVAKLIEHTEKLTIQTNEHIQHSQTLTKQTDILIGESKGLREQTDVLITESKGLRRLTWGLLIFTIGLLLLTAGLLYIDWHREHEPQQITATK